jgi:hypothetical protein
MSSGLPIKPLDVGVERVTRWQADDEIHLPREGSLQPQFLPEARALDEILQRPSLDERLPRLLQPASLTPELLQPHVLAAARQGAIAAFLRRAKQETGERRDALEAAARLVLEESARDEEVRAALAALLRG